MPRPRAPEPIVKLSKDFALLLTTTEDARCEFIARHGKASLFQALSGCVPSVVPPCLSLSCKPSGSKLVITEAQFLKVLQKSGAFKKFRHRKAARIEEDPSGAGMCMFQGVRWRDPSDASDYEALAEGYKEMCGAHAIFARECSFEQLVSVLSGMVQLWHARWPEFGRRRGKAGTQIGEEGRGGKAGESSELDDEDFRPDEEVMSQALLSCNEASEMILEEPSLDDFCFLPECEMSLIPTVLAVSVMNEIDFRSL